MIWLIVLGVIALLLFVWFKFFKIPKLRNLVFIDGTLGAGKSFYSVSLAVRLYKRAYRRWRIQKAIGSLAKRLRLKRLGKLAETEEPMLYSNIPLRRVKHVPLTLDLMTRKTRFAYKSVVFIDELSMLVDQFDYKDREISEALREFVKLFRHETKGGYIVLNSQSTSDLHYSFKSSLSDYLYIHHKTRLPFFSILSVQEMAYSADKDAHAVVNAENSDIEENLKIVLVPNKYFKYFDTYCYSILSDGLNIEDTYIVLDKKASAKAPKVLSFKAKYNKEKVK